LPKKKNWESGSASSMKNIFFLKM